MGQPSPGHEVTGSGGRGRSLHQPREATWTSVGTRPGQHGQHGHPRRRAPARLVIRIDSCDRDGQLDKNQYCCEKVCSRLGCALTAEQWAVSPLHPAPPRPHPAPLTRRAFKVGQGRYWCWWAGRGGLTQPRDRCWAGGGWWLVAGAAPPRHDRYPGGGARESRALRGSCGGRGHLAGSLAAANTARSHARPHHRPDPHRSPGKQESKDSGQAISCPGPLLAMELALHSIMY